MNMLNVASPKKRISQGVSSAYVVIPFIIPFFYLIIWSFYNNLNTQE